MIQDKDKTKASSQNVIHGTAGKNKESTSMVKQNHKANSFQQEVKLAKTLFIVFMVFCVCWTPYALMCLIDRYDQVPKEVYTFGVLMAHTSSTLNSILYAVTNKGLRKGYKKFICIACRTE